MIRLLLLLILMAAVALGATWVADRPGTVEMEWLGWRLETSTFFLLIAFALVSVTLTRAASAQKLFHAVGMRGARQLACSAGQASASASYCQPCRSFHAARGETPASSESFMMA